MKILATLKAIWICYAISRSTVIPRISCHLLIVYKLVMEEFWFSFHTQKKNEHWSKLHSATMHTHTHTHISTLNLGRFCFFFVFRSVPVHINESYKKILKIHQYHFQKIDLGFDNQFFVSMLRIHNMCCFFFILWFKA